MIAFLIYADLNYGPLLGLAAMVGAWLIPVLLLV